jgi:hypothetical protein
MYMLHSTQPPRSFLIYSNHPSPPQGAMSRCSNRAMRSGSQPDSMLAAALPSLGSLRVLQRPALSNEYCLHCMSPSHLALQSLTELIAPLSTSLSLSQPEPGVAILGKTWEWKTSLCRRTVVSFCVNSVSIVSYYRGMYTPYPLVRSKPLLLEVPQVLNDFRCDMMV